MVFSTVASSPEKAAAPESDRSIVRETTIAANLENLLIFFFFTPSCFLPNAIIHTYSQKVKAYYRMFTVYLLLYTIFYPAKPLKNLT